jgi:hypothetical protein
MRKELLVGLMLLGMSSVSRAQSIIPDDRKTSNQPLDSVPALDESNAFPTSSVSYSKATQLIPRPEPTDAGENDPSMDNALEKPHPQLDLRAPAGQKTGTAEETQLGDEHICQPSKHRLWDLRKPDFSTQCPDDASRPDLLPYKYGPSAKSFWAAWGIAGGAVVANTELYERYDTNRYRPVIPRSELYSVGLGCLIGFIVHSEPRLRHEPYENDYKTFAGALAAVYSGFGLGTLIRRSH